MPFQQDCTGTGKFASVEFRDNGERKYGHVIVIVGSPSMSSSAKVS